MGVGDRALVGSLSESTEETGLVALVLLLWLCAILLFINRWGKIRMLEPYMPAFDDSKLDDTVSMSLKRQSVAESIHRRQSRFIETSNSSRVNSEEGLRRVIVESSTRHNSLMIPSCGISMVPVLRSAAATRQTSHSRGPLLELTEHPEGAGCGRYGRRAKSAADIVTLVMADYRNNPRPHTALERLQRLSGTPAASRISLEPPSPPHSPPSPPCSVSETIHRLDSDQPTGRDFIVHTSCQHTAV